MNILILRGYYSKGDSVDQLIVDDIKIKITTVALGSPVLVRRKLKKIIKKYNINTYNYDRIYAISMSANITSLVEVDVYKKLHLITPFFINPKSMCVLRKVNFRKFVGAYLLLLINGKLGEIHQSIKVTLAEKDDIVDNEFFKDAWQDAEVIEGIDHYFDDDIIKDIVKRDIQLLKTGTNG